MSQPAREPSRTFFVQPAGLKQNIKLGDEARLVAGQTRLERDNVRGMIGAEHRLPELQASNDFPHFNGGLMFGKHLKPIHRQGCVGRDDQAQGGKKPRLHPVERLSRSPGVLP